MKKNKWILYKRRTQLSRRKWIILSQNLIACVLAFRADLHRAVGWCKIRKTGHHDPVRSPFSGMLQDLQYRGFREVMECLII